MIVFCQHGFEKKTKHSTGNPNPGSMGNPNPLASSWSIEHAINLGNKEM